MSDNVQKRFLDSSLCCISFVYNDVPLSGRKSVYKSHQRNWTLRVIKKKKKTFLHVVTPSCILSFTIWVFIVIPAVDIHWLTCNYKYVLSFIKNWFVKLWVIFSFASYCRLNQKTGWEWSNILCISVPFYLIALVRML